MVRRARSTVKVGVVKVHRLGRVGLVAVAALLLGGAGPAVARAQSHPAPKVVVIVGPAGTATPFYQSLADATAAAAARLTPDVVRISSPDATWERVRAALQGASIVVYLGHGNGWPSIYHDALFPATEDGFGLNPESGVADAHQYFGEARIAAEIKLAPNAVVVFSHLCYASGNSEPGLPEGTLDVAQQRVDNYAAGFLAAGAGAVIADADLSPEYYVTSLLRGTGTVAGIWRAAPNRNDHFLTFSSSRTKGAVASMDPQTPDSGFIRSLVARPGLRASAVVGGGTGGSSSAPPVAEPTLTGLGLTFGSPDLATPPTAGQSSKLLLPVAPSVAGLLPKQLLAATRWDRLDQPPVAPNTPPGTATATPTPSGPPDLVVPEVPGEVVAPVRTTRLKTGGIEVPVRMPAAPGLYRLVTSLHTPDGLAFDAATQALIPALVVRVVGPATAAYQVQPTATTAPGEPLQLSVGVTNLGTTAWGRAPGRRPVGPDDVVNGTRATLVARWVSLGADSGDVPDGGHPGVEATSVGLPAGLAPGASAVVSIALVAPATPGDYLAVFDVVDADGSSLAAAGVPPGIVRVTVAS